VKKQLVIIGNSGAARECYWLAKDCIDAGENMEFKGFLSFEGYQGYLHELSDYFLGVDDAYTPAQDDIFVIGIGSPALREKAFNKWKNIGIEFCNLIHPTVKIIGNTKIGGCNIFSHGTYISCDTTIGSCNYFNGSVVVGHDVNIGSFNFFSPFSILLGNSTVGSKNLFGINSVLLQTSNIGDNNIITPGSYIYKGCKNGMILSGNPALSIGRVDDLI